MKYFGMISLLFVTACGIQMGSTVTPQLGAWRVNVLSPGGDLPLNLIIERADNTYKATIVNGEEHFKLDSFFLDDNRQIRFGVEHYESFFDGVLSESGDKIVGEWTKVVGQDKKSKLPFEAVFGSEQRFQLTSTEEAVNVSGRWAVTFRNGDNEEPAIGEFHQEGNKLTGTFLTPLGDYRFLAGNVDGNQMKLSCFDGGHMFLFSATLDEEGKLSGDFYSRDNWHETWTAVRDEKAQLPDPYAMTSLKPGLKAFRFAFKDLDGNTVSHDDPALQGKVRIVTIFGSWCPNCNDEAVFLRHLDETYGDRGLEIIALAFEMTPDEARNIRVLQRYKKRHDVDYRILLAGNSTSKGEAARVLPDLEHVKSFPTTILINRQGEVDSIHTGFRGPGTGMYYERQSKHYIEAVERLLAEKDPS